MHRVPVKKIIKKPITDYPYRGEQGDRDRKEVENYYTHFRLFLNFQLLYHVLASTIQSTHQ